MTETNIHAVQGRIARFGLQICVGFPVAMFVLANLAHSTFSFLATPITSEHNLKLLSYVFIGVSVVDGFIAFLIKRRLINTRALLSRYRFSPDSFAGQLTAAYVPIFAICALPALYGLVFFFLGGDLDTYVLISIMCPASFLLLKPREQEIERLMEEIFRPTENGDIRL